MTARPLSVPVPMRPHVEIPLGDEAAAWRCPTCHAEKWTPRRYVRLHTLCAGCGRAVEWDPIDLDDAGPKRPTERGTNGAG